mmetsp:Transcript_36271/g.73765  ORF Transcript_36271/g.73765 Transcript_36271/m.73765 type:complete len:90 (-) Transcript_36271:202-471(-)
MSAFILKQVTFDKLDLSEGPLKKSSILFVEVFGRFLLGLRFANFGFLEAKHLPKRKEAVQLCKGGPADACTGGEAEILGGGAEGDGGLH